MIIKTSIVFFLLTQDFVVDLLINSINENHESEGMLISGFPRNVEQIHRFEKKVIDLMNLLTIRVALSKNEEVCQLY